MYVYAEREGGRERGRDTGRDVDKSVEEWLRQGCEKQARINDSSRDDRDHSQETGCLELYLHCLRLQKKAFRSSNKHLPSKVGALGGGPDDIEFAPFGCALSRPRRCSNC